MFENPINPCNLWSLVNLWSVAKNLFSLFSFFLFEGTRGGE